MTGSTEHIAPPDASKFVIRRSDGIKKRPIQWLWKPYLVKGALNLLTGDPGIGKSTLVCELVARLSRGLPFPGTSESQPPTSCWIMNGEDNAEDTIVWRLENQGADMTRVWITDAVRTIDRPSAEDMFEFIQDRQIGMVIVDPLQAWIGASVDMHRANETRPWTELLRAICLKTGCAMVIVRHRRKSAAGDARLYSGMGSIDFTGACRSEVGVIEAKDKTRFITRMKGNVKETRVGMAYEIVGHSDPLNDHGILKWRGPYDEDLEAAKARSSRVPKGLKKAQQFIHDYLRDGPKPSLDVLAAGSRAGISDRTMKRAKEGVARSRQIGPKQWVWELENTTPSESAPLTGDDEPVTLTCKWPDHDPASLNGSPLDA